MINCCPYCGCGYPDLRPTSRAGVSMRPDRPRVLTLKGLGTVVGNATSCEDGKIRNFLMVKLDCGKTEPFGHNEVAEDNCYAPSFPCCNSSKLQPEKGYSFSCVHPEGKLQVGELINLPSGQEAQILGFHVRWVVETPKGWWTTQVVMEYRGGSSSGKIIAHYDGIVDKRCYADIPPCHCPYLQLTCWVPEDQELLWGERRDYYHTLCANVKEIEIPYKGYTVLVVQCGAYYEIVGVISRRHYRLDHCQSVSEIVLLPWKEINEIKRRARLLDCHGYVHYWGKE